MDRSAAARPVSFRPEGPGDAGTVRDAHVAHRRSVLGAAGLPPDALDRLCAFQHDLQERHIGVHHPLAERRMIVVGGRPIGRLCLDRTSRPWRIVDLTILQDEQGSGSGTAVLRELLDEAADHGAELELHVAIDNPRAAALYRRLGFTDLPDASETHRRMVSTPRTPADGKPS